MAAVKGLVAGSMRWVSCRRTTTGQRRLDRVRWATLRTHRVWRAGRLLSDSLAFGGHNASLVLRPA